MKLWAATSLCSFSVLLILAVPETHFHQYLTFHFCQRATCRAFQPNSFDASSIPILLCPPPFRTSLAPLSAIHLVHSQILSPSPTCAISGVRLLAKTHSYGLPYLSSVPRKKCCPSLTSGYSALNISNSVCNLWKGCSIKNRRKSQQSVTNCSKFCGSGAIRGPTLIFSSRIYMTIAGWVM